MATLLQRERPGQRPDPALCGCFDRDLDQEDLKAFHRCLSGPNILADPGCELNLSDNPPPPST